MGLDKRLELAVAVCLAAAFSGPTAGAACPTPAEAISTDRPDVTNSSQVVPTGSLQVENGADLSVRSGTRVLDGTNTRLRLGIANCLEVLVDLPSYAETLGAGGGSGFSDIAPAVKHQLAPLPGDIDLAVTVGIGVPIAGRRDGHRDYEPYLQLPWSHELSAGWGISGMATAFFHTGEDPHSILEPTFVVERQLGNAADLFVEYVGDFPAGGHPTHLFNSGGAYRISSTQQLDFHAGFGLNRGAADYIVGVGYSFRLDRLF